MSGINEYKACLVFWAFTLCEKAVFLTRILHLSGVYTMDLKNGTGSVKQGNSGGKADCIITVAEQVSLPPFLVVSINHSDAFPSLVVHALSIDVCVLATVRTLSTWCRARRQARSFS